MCRGSRFVGLSLILALGAFEAPAQSFQHGDLYLISVALAGPGGTSRAGVLHINQTAWSGMYYAIAGENISGQPAYDPSRDRLVIPIFHGRLLLLDAAGGVTYLPVPAQTQDYLAAPTGDGRIYTVRIGSGAFGYFDASNSYHDVLNPAGLATHVISQPSLVYFHKPSNSLVTADQTSATALTLRRHDLNAGGTQVTNVTTTTFDVSPAGDLAVGMSRGPGNTVFIKVDDNENALHPRMLLLNPVTMGVSVFASSNYFGVAGEVAGVWRVNAGDAIVLDSLSNHLRAYAQGFSGEGPIVMSGEVSSLGGSGERATLISIDKCRADLSGDGGVDGADLAALLASWGQPGSTDLNGDGTTDGADLAIVLAAWGGCS